MQVIYQQSGSSSKVVEALAAKGDFDQLATYTRSSGECEGHEWRGGQLGREEGGGWGGVVWADGVVHAL
jgi:hypothetical protein